MLVEPFGIVLVEQIATPPESVLVVQPDRFVQVIVPVGVAAPGELTGTAAVQVINCP
jgi:hypothetical protein